MLGFVDRARADQHGPTLSVQTANLLLRKKTIDARPVELLASEHGHLAEPLGQPVTLERSV